MADDIIIQLKDLAATLNRGEGRSTVYGAVSEIERLREELQKEKQAHWKHHLYKGAEILNMPDKAACDE